MYRKTLISMAVLAFLCLLSINEREAVNCLVSDVHPFCLAEAVADFHPDYGDADALAPASTGTSASEVKNPRGSRMPVKRSHCSSSMTRSKVSINTISCDLKVFSRVLLYPSGKEKTDHHLISLRKLII